MNVAIDLDGTIDAYPSMFLALMAALKHSANHVTVLTGIDDGKVTPAIIKEKADYLAELGFAELYDELIVVTDPHKQKAKWIEDNKVHLFIDNSRQNLKAAASECPCLLMWQTREK